MTNKSDKTIHLKKLKSLHKRVGQAWVRYGKWQEEAIRLFDEKMNEREAQMRKEQEQELQLQA